MKNVHIMKIHTATCDALWLKKNWLKKKSVKIIGR